MKKSHGGKRKSGLVCRAQLLGDLAPVTSAAYGTLLLGGGIFAYARSGSKGSILGGISGASLMTIAYYLMQSPETEEIGTAIGFASAFLFSSVFGIRLAATRKFIPSGLLLSLSVGALAVFLSAYMQTKKIVVKVGLQDDKEKRKAMKAVATLQGIDSVAIEMKDKKMTVIGEVDPIDIVGKLRKGWATEIVSVGPKEEPKKDEGKKKEEEEKKKKEEEEKKEKIIKEFMEASYGHLYVPNRYYAPSGEENPNACAIL
ncbi:hypothetical protein ZIOFF_010338 [Zingiber officinale]|uniref:HMA domain-containing protein n=1 Tax=Zingiber officinale TaxID=94328 RepID=A0A8J5HPA8_ZINOF|nr:hypothetical protein ZIOFF_010338 [Zingiber officinale]